MAITLAESAKLSQDKLHRKVVEELIKISPLLKRIPFVTIEGNSIKIPYEDVSNVGSVGFYAVNDAITESTAKWLTRTYSLTKLIGDADVDNLIQQTRSNFFNQMGEQVRMKTKLMAHAFDETAIYGTSTNSNEFLGFQWLERSTTQRIHMGATTTGATLTLAKLDELVDAIPGGEKPDILLLNKQINRRLAQKLRGVGSYMTERDAYGDYWQFWNGVPLVVTDWIGQVESIAATIFSAKTGGSCSSIIAVKFGEGDGVVGFNSGDIQTDTWDKLEQKDASRTRLRWYLGMGSYSAKCIAILDGIVDDTMA